MFRPAYFIALSLLLSPVTGFAGETPDVHSPAFTAVPELTAGFDLLYEQKFAEAREAFASWDHAIRRIPLVRWPWPPAISSRSYTFKAY